MLVVFDCDGVLVDSEELSAQVFSQVLAQYNFILSAEDCFKLFRGHTLNQCLEMLESDLGFPIPQDFLPKLNAATLDAFDRHLKPIAGVADVLDHLNKKSIPICVASNGGYQKLKHSLEFLNFDHYFGAFIYSAEFFEQGKPSPEMFLKAAADQNTAPNQCVVIEDSIPGVQAALAAGMNVCHYKAGQLGVKALKCDQASNRDLVKLEFGSMDQLPKILEDLELSLEGKSSSLAR